VERIVAALGLTMSDLFPSSNGHAARGKGQIVKAYDYQDERGELVSQAVRFEPKGFAQRRPRRPDDDVAALRAGRVKFDDEWVWSIQDVQPVVYRLPELLAADPSVAIFVVEGEKDADALAALGFVATTNAMGAGKWKAEYNESLRGRDVVVIPDNDNPG